MIKLNNAKAFDWLEYYLRGLTPQPNFMLRKEHKLRLDKLDNLGFCLGGNVFAIEHVLDTRIDHVGMEQIKE